MEGMCVFPSKRVTSNAGGGRRKEGRSINRMRTQAQGEYRDAIDVSLSSGLINGLIRGYMHVACKGTKKAYRETGPGKIVLHNRNANSDL